MQPTLFLTPGFDSSATPLLRMQQSQSVTPGPVIEELSGVLHGQSTVAPAAPAVSIPSGAPTSGALPAHVPRQRGGAGFGNKRLRTKTTASMLALPANNRVQGIGDQIAL